MQQALTEREELITARARTLALHALSAPPPWAEKLGPPPIDPDAAAEHAKLLAVVIAYRDRYGITITGDPLGPIPDGDAQRIDYERARAAARILDDQIVATPDSAPFREPPSRSR